MSASAVKFGYVGNGGELLLLFLKNAILTVLTLGIYSFWAKNAVREFHYRNTEFDGDRFAYHGTGGELLRGALKAFAIVILIGGVFLGLTTVAGIAGRGEPGSPPVAMFTSAFYLTFALLMVVAIHGVRKYRLSRSSLRGIRFSYHGELGPFFAMMATGFLLSVVTLGFYLPWFANHRRAFLVNNALYGNEPFLYDGEGRDLFKPFVTALLLTIPTLGLCWLWYRAFAHRYVWSHTAMREARFHSTVTGREMLQLYVTNLLLVMFTLGIGTPWAITRQQRYFTDNVVFLGSVEWANVRQHVQAASATAEGLADGFDIDVGIGM